MKNEAQVVSFLDAENDEHEIVEARWGIVHKPTIIVYVDDSGTMFLNQKKAAELAAILQRFADTGRLGE